MQAFESGMIPDSDFSLSSGFQESEFSDNYSDATLSRSNSLEKLKLAEGCIEETFRIDRKKLEAMILGCPPDPWDTEVMKIPIDKHGRVKSALEFFEEIMEATNTIIKYPKNLKVGSRNKRDPPVRVIGLPEAVAEACQRINYDLYPQNKITMKLDVPWTFHSHIIGKGGQTIQPVVKRTGVSIHFPDGNKNSDTFKSNQVSLNTRGDEISGLEEARSAIRRLTPLIFTFFLPTSIISAVNFETLIQHVQALYHVQVEFGNIEDNLFGSIKGSEGDHERVKEATLCLLRALCGDIAIQIQVQNTLEISPQYHAFIIGRSHISLKEIERSTATRITFPDLNDVAMPLLRRSTVTISGSLMNVYLARGKIVGSIPIQLMFDAPSDLQMDEYELRQIRQTLEVDVNVRGLREGGRRSIIIKGAERNATSVYEAWRLISKSEKSAPRAKIPSSYNLEDPYSWCSLNSVMSSLNYMVCSRSPYEINNMNLMGTPAAFMNTADEYSEMNNNSVFCPGGFVDQWSPPPPEVRLQSQTNSSFGSPSSGDKSMSSFTAAETDISSMLGRIKISEERRAPGCEKEMRDYTAKKILAEEAKKQPMLPMVPRVPTSNWAGYGLSKSYDGIQTSKADNQSKLVSMHTEYHEPGWFRSVLPPSIDEVEETFDAASSYVTILLIKLQLEQYCDLFSSYNIDFDKFCKLSEEELLRMGVNSFEHRKKIVMAIKNLRLCLY